MTEHLLEVRDLSIEFHTAAGTVKAVQNVSWHLDRGETLAILGESGSGKSVSASAIMNLIDMPPGRITSGQIRFGGQDLLTLSDEQRRAVNGRRIAMIFQDPLSHLNPVYTVGWQIAEAMTTHGTDQARAKAEALRLLTRVGIPDPAGALKKYPHEFSGGQRQRLMIAMALAMKPDVLIADEPTTALDVTVQAEVLSLLEELQAETGMGILIITHDLGVVAEIADRVVVMNGGVVVETGSAAQVYANPSHPYTRKLIGAAPGKGAMRSVLMIAVTVAAIAMGGIWGPALAGTLGVSTQVGVALVTAGANIVGSLLEIGAGAQPEHWMGELLAGRDRSRAGPTAPAAGLVFLGPLYPPEWGLPAEVTFAT